MIVFTLSASCAYCGQPAPLVFAPTAAERAAYPEDMEPPSTVVDMSSRGKYLHASVDVTDASVRGDLRAQLQARLWLLGCRHVDDATRVMMERFRDAGYWTPTVMRARGEEPVDLSTHKHLAPRVSRTSDGGAVGA